MAETTQLLDLDALQPEPKRVKLNGETHIINPPGVGDYINLMKLSKRADGSVVASDEDALTVLQEFKTFVDHVAPSLVDKQLTMDQMLAIVQLVTTMVEPMEAKMHEATGIYPAQSAEKKTSDLAS